MDKASQWEVGANYFDVCHDSDPIAGDVKEALTKITQGKMLSFNTQYSCHSLEEERWFELNIRPLVSRSDLFLIQHRNITDQVIAKLESTKLQHQITEIANSGPGMVYQFKGAPDGTYSFPFVSEGARQIFDLEPEVLIKNASKAFELVLEEDLNELLESIERVISNPRRWQHSFRIKTARGIRHLQGCSSPSMIGEDGTVTFNGVILDVTEKTTAQTELDRNRRLLALAGKMAGVGGWHIDLAKNKLFWTEQTYRIYGLNPELPAPTVEEAIQFYAPEARSIIKNAVEEGIRERSSFDLELPFFNKEGRRQWVRAIGEPVFEGENVAGLTGTFQDITTQKKTELSLLDTKRRLELAKSSAGIGVWVYNPVTLELEWDEQMFQIFDFAEDEFPNTYEGWRQTVHPEDLAKAETDLTEALESLESFHSSFRIIHKSDKSVHYIEAHAHIVRDEDGHAVEVFGVNWDITESKLAEKEREDLQIQRSHSQRLETIGTMAGGLAHDLNNILTPIMGHSDMILEDKSLPDYLREDAEAISTGALRAREIIEKILSFSQKKEKKRGTVFVQALIKEAVSLLKPAIPSRIQLDLDVDGDCPPSLPMPRRSMS